MANYVFETITPSQALAYNSATDTLTFSNPNIVPNEILMQFGGDGTITIATAFGRVTFGSGLYGETDLIFATGSRAALGGAGDDILISGGGNDYLSGGPGNDTLAAQSGLDRLQGGPGADLFIVNSSTVFQNQDQIIDWEPADRLTFGGPAGTSANYAISHATDYNGALTDATQQFRLGQFAYLAAQVGPDVFVFGGDGHGNVVGAIQLLGVTTASIGFSNIVAMPQFSAASLPALPSSELVAPSPLVSFGIPSAASGTIRGDMDTAHIGSLVGATITDATPNHLQLDGLTAHLSLSGTGFVYDANEQLIGGIATGVTYDSGDFTTGFHVSLTLAGVSAAPFGQWVATDTTSLALQTILAGGANIFGQDEDDLIHGGSGNDTIEGTAGNDTIYGGAGDDQIYALRSPLSRDGIEPASSTYLRGEQGNDYIVGGQGFDDINGNQGDDTCSGGLGNDWVVGGQGDDLLFGNEGDDIVYGNLGNDTCAGDAGNDLIRGGQGDDSLVGGAGNDWISGDRGSDTLTGGAGADTFHTFAGAGLDVVTDFNASEGDRVQVDPGTSYTLSQSGADVIVDMGAGDEMILRNVQLSSLPAGWIFAA